MKRSSERTVSGQPAASRTRRGAGGIRALGALVVLAAGLAGGWWFVDGRLADQARSDLLTHQVVFGTFLFDVTERGQVDSSESVDVRCEVMSRNMSGTAIIQIVPEGTIVKQGDFLVKLDDSAHQSDLTTQQIAVNSSEAAVTQATNELDSAIAAKREYEEGTYKQEEEKLESELFVAEENFSRAEEYLRYSDKLAARGYITEIQLKADRFAVDKAKKELDVANTKLYVLREFTGPKTIKKHAADIKTAEAKLANEQAKRQLELEKLALIEDQIEKCMINAPAAGQVVYAEEEDWRDDGMIKEGVTVRERQLLIRLPNPKQMQVEARISESRIERVKAGMTAQIKVDAIPGLVLRGTVTKVNEYPEPEHWSSASVRHYAALVKIEDPPPALRTGMNVEVAIRVQSTPDAVQVPVQAILERGGRHYCLVSDAAQPLEPREVTIGTSNDKFVVIQQGLTADDEVVMNPAQHLDGIELGG